MNTDKFTTTFDADTKFLKVSRLLFFIWLSALPYLWIVFSLIIACLFIALKIEGKSNITHVEIVMNFVDVAVIILVLYKTKKLIEVPKQSVEKGFLKPLPESAITNEIRKTLDSMAEKLGVNRDNLRYLCDGRSREVTPSTVNFKKLSYVIIPAGFIKEFPARRGAFEGLLAHELAHIKHDDSEFVLYFQYFPRVVYMIYVPFLVLDALINIYLHPSLQTDMYGLFSSAIMAVGLCSFANSIHQRMELYADIATVDVVAKPEMLIDFYDGEDKRRLANLKNAKIFPVYEPINVALDRRFPSHPSYQQRIKSLTKALALKNKPPHHLLPYLLTGLIIAALASLAISHYYEEQWAAIVVPMLILTVIVIVGLIRQRQP